MAQRPPIFISARFRSGSTMLWNIFRSISRYTAYYEPLHDNLLANYANPTTDATHQGVTSYWSEYAEILELVREYQQPSFAYDRLLLEAGDTHADLKNYLQMLIANAFVDTSAVLQFNRVDFRLPWLREQFPDAILVHLFRNPRDSWVSMMRGLPAGAWEDPTPEDPYDLLAWSFALEREFPFLTRKRCSNSYARHYYLHRLSTLMGERVADCSLDYDLDFQQDSAVGLDKLCAVCPELARDREQLQRLIKPSLNSQWQKHRSEQWFEQIEREADSLLDELGLAESFGLKPLAVIREEYHTAWEQCERQSRSEVTRKLLDVYSRARSRHIETFPLTAALSERIAFQEQDLVRLREAEQQWNCQSARWTAEESQWQQERSEWSLRAAEWDQERSDWSVSRSSWEQERNAWERSRDAWEQQRAVWQAEQEQWDQERLQWQTERSAWQAEVREGRNRESELRGDIVRLNEQIEWFMRERKSLELEHEELEKQLDTLAYQVDILTAQRQVLIEQLADVQALYAPFRQLGPLATTVAQAINWVGRKVPWIADPVCELLNRYLKRRQIAREQAAVTDGPAADSGSVESVDSQRHAA